ncbi:MAG: heavy metal transporter [Flavobacteriaceae bacterium]|nr:heavy metal transporter [Flavobacteriaceae bacterium]
MKQSYTISGMTCEGCKASVMQALNSVKEIQHVDINLEKEEAEITLVRDIPLSDLQKALSSKYSISERKEANIFQSGMEGLTPDTNKSKFQQLQPLFLIFAYIIAAAFLLNYELLDVGSFMLDFMGLFFIVFSFFKILDLKGFPDSFRMYDPLAKAIPVYGWLYPFIETALGLMFLLRFETGIALIATIIILGVTTVGVTRSLLGKQKITCACLGTALKLPMTEATFIENAIMILMAIFMIIKTFAI